MWLINNFTQSNTAALFKNKQSSGSATKQTIMKITGILFLILFPLLSAAQTITVKQDSTGDFTTIQAAVDSAQNGDTVLVWPGTYVENIHIINKSIFLGSLTLTTGDLAYINQTVIDGNDSGSCIRIEYADGNIINGFEVVNGNGKEKFWMDGGGLFLLESNTSIYNCFIHSNEVGSYGGGIYFCRSDGYLSNVTITDNFAYDRGGGIVLLRGHLEFDTINRCNIYENYAGEGTDIFKLGAPAMDVYVDTFTVQNPDYYYVFSKDSIELPQNDIQMNIQHGKITQAFEDLYVAPNGSNDNSGLSAKDALKTISYALLKIASDSVSPDTIHVAAGTYSDSLTKENFPLSLKSFVTLKGESRDSTILDAENIIYHLKGVSSAKNFNVFNFTLKKGNGNINSPYRFGSFRIGLNFNVRFRKLLFTENLGDVISCGVFYRINNCTLDNVEMSNNVGGKAFRVGHASIFPNFDTVWMNNCQIVDNLPNYNSNDVGNGGGLSILGRNINAPIFTTVIVTNTLFANNKSASYSAPTIAVWWGARLYLVNNTIVDNLAETSEGGNIGVLNNAEINIYNSIMYHNEPVELYMSNYSNKINKLNVYTSLIDGGEENIRILTSGNIYYYDTTNIDTDPLFYGGPDFPYNLSDESPCIDAGTLELPQFILDHMPDTDLAGNPRIVNGKIDMGAYEWNPTVDAKEVKNKTLKTAYLAVYPNPFNRQTTISAQWNKSARVGIEVYNSAGLLLKTLQQGNQLPGSCALPWDGTDNHGSYLPAGVYLVVLTVNGKELESVKIIKE